MADVRVSLADGRISVDKNKVSISRSAGETVSWESKDGEFGIRFAKGAGIPDPVIAPRGGKWRGSAGPFPPDGTVKDGTVKYDVTSPGLDDLDPELDIKP